MHNKIVLYIFEVLCAYSTIFFAYKTGSLTLIVEYVSRMVSDNLAEVKHYIKEN